MNNIMKLLFVCLLLPGFGLGAGSAYASSAGEPIEFTVNMPEDALSFTHGFSTGLMRIPEQIENFENSPLSPMIAATFRLRDKGGNLVGIASELEIFPDELGPRPDISWKTDWTITTSAGSIYIHQDERVPAVHIPAFAQLMEGKNWEGSLMGQISSGPHASGRGIIIGGTGVYAGASGTFVEKVDLQALSIDGKMRGIMILQIYLD